MKTGIELIALERAEQIEKHGRTIQADVLNNDHRQLAAAAHKLCDPLIYSRHMISPPQNWNQSIWEHMVIRPYKERLIIAGALIAAEIDRIQSLQYNPEEQK